MNLPEPILHQILEYVPYCWNSLARTCRGIRAAIQKIGTKCSFRRFKIRPRELAHCGGDEHLFDVLNMALHSPPCYCIEKTTAYLIAEWGRYNNGREYIDKNYKKCPVHITRLLEISLYRPSVAATLLNGFLEVTTRHKIMTYLPDMLRGWIKSCSSHYQCRNEYSAELSPSMHDCMIELGKYDRSYRKLIELIERIHAAAATHSDTREQYQAVADILITLASFSIWQLRHINDPACTDIIVAIGHMHQPYLKYLAGRNIGNYTQAFRLAKE